MSFEEAVDEIIIGSVAFDDDLEKKAAYTLQNYRELKPHLPEEKHRPMLDLVTSFLRGKLGSDAFRQKAIELRGA